MHEFERRRPRFGPAPSPAKEDGTGLIATVFGVAVFLVFVLFGVQVIFDLYSRSTVSAVAYDAARTVAESADPGPGTQAVAEAAARHELGSYSAHVSFAWTVDADTVSLSVHAQNPTLVPSLLATPLGLDSVDRTIRVRRESFR